jgi:ADP-ribose pyrophosphatase
MMELKRASRATLYRGKVFDLIVDEVEYPSGTRGIREIAHHPGGAAVVPITDQNEVVLIQQLRYPFANRLLEIPAGKLIPGEDPSAAAARELREETGLVATRLEKLLSIYTTPGFCDEIIHLFLGTGLSTSLQGHAREEGESSMTVHRFPMETALAMIDKGEIKDAKTIIGLTIAEQHLHESRSAS